jgi:hypothetical protein
MATIRELDSGSWQAIVRRRGIKPVVRTFTTKTDAKRWASVLESEIARGVFLDRSEGERTTMAELIDRYLSEVTPNKKSASREVLHLNALKRHFGRLSLASLRSSHISEYRDARLASGLAGATVVKELNSLSHLFDVAIKDWGIALPANPVKLVRRPHPAHCHPAGHQDGRATPSAFEYRRSCRHIQSRASHFRLASILDVAAGG